MRYNNEIFGIYIGHLDEDACANICTNYVDMNHVIMELNEDQILHCLEYERKNRKRANILNRLYTRFNSLRKNRERLELLR